MILAKSLSDAKSDGLIIEQETIPGARLTTDEVLHRFDDLLFQHSTRKKGIILLSPTRSDEGTSINMLVLETTQKQPEEIVAEAMSRILAAA